MFTVHSSCVGKGMQVIASEHGAIQPTRSGQFLVRHKWGDDMKCLTLAEAQSEMVQRDAEWQSFVTATNTSLQEQQQFQSAHSDLVARQIAWQRWRNGEYQTLCMEARRVRNNARHADRKTATLQSRVLSRDQLTPDNAVEAMHCIHIAEVVTESEHSICDNERRILAEMDAAYQMVVDVDCRVKAAYAARDAVAWTAALDEAAQLQSR